MYVFISHLIVVNLFYEFVYIYIQLINEYIQIMIEFLTYIYIPIYHYQLILFKLFAH